MPSLTFQAEELASQQVNYIKEARDFYAFYSQFADKMLTGNPTDTGGQKLIWPIKINRHSVGTNLSTGFEPLRTVARPMFTEMVGGYSVYIRPAWWNLRDTIQNRGPGQILNIQKERTDDMMQGTRQDYTEQTLRGVTTDLDENGNSVMADVTPINGDDSTTGFIEAQAVGAQDNVVFTFNKATYQALPGAQNQWISGANSFSSNAWSTTNRVAVRARKYAQVVGGANHEWYVSNAFAEFWGELLQPQERYAPDAVKSGAGKSGSDIKFDLHGIPACLEDKMPNAGSATTAAPWSALLVDHKNMYFRGQAGYVNLVKPWVSIPGTPEVMVSLNILAGNNVIQYFATQGLVTGLEQW